MNNEAVVNKSTSNPLALNSVIRVITTNLSKLFYLSISFLIYLGWKNKELSNLSPESGAGYWLGIIGGSLMLLLLLYPLRKKVRFLNMFGKIKYWFKLHMLFGVLGPVAILFHANFSLGSTNSNVALFSMIIVASSGLVGRYLYAKIHHGLYGRKAELKELRESLKEAKDKLGSHFKLTATVVKKIKNSERLLLRNRNIILASLVWPIIFIRTAWLKRTIRKAITKAYLSAAQSKGWDKKMTRLMSRDANNEVQPYVDGYIICMAFAFLKVFFLCGIFYTYHFLLCWF